MAEEDECDLSFSAPAATSCESTNYCRLGCCYNTDDGECSPNTAKRTCDEKGGTWSPEADCDITQCQMGCCILGTEAFLDTYTGCKFQSTAFNVEINFKKNIQNEIDCKLQVASETLGACVYERDFEKTCKFTTQKECLELRIQQTGETEQQVTQSWFDRLFGGNEEETEISTVEVNVEFFEGRLCTDESLETNCAKSTKTTCYDEKVYYTDTCNNRANIYDSEKYDDNSYWTRVYEMDEVCDDGNGNKNSATCGNCDYYSGSFCGLKKTGDASPAIGDNLCRSLDCKYNGETYSHGESWCATEEFGNLGISKNLPGSEYFILDCHNGEVTTIPCKEMRKEICVEEDINGFNFAICTLNRWQDCYAQTEEKDCENEDRRDCIWQESKWTGEEANCIPKYAPGLNFWEIGSEVIDTSSSTQVCSRGNFKCKVTYEKGLFTKYDCKKNCFCLEQEWMDFVLGTCSSLGDCGMSVNYISQEGYYEEEDLFDKN